MDPLSLSAGDQISFVVGLDDVTELFAYTVGIEIDPTELAFVSARQLAASGILELTVDPGDGLSSGGTGRASFLLTSAVSVNDGPS